MLQSKYAIQTKMVENGSVVTSRTEGYKNLEQVRMDIRRMVREKPLASIVAFNAKGVAKIYIKFDEKGNIVIKEGRL